MSTPARYKLFKGSSPVYEKGKSKMLSSKIKSKQVKERLDTIPELTEGVSTETPAKSWLLETFKDDFNLDVERKSNQADTEIQAETVTLPNHTEKLTVLFNNYQKLFDKEGSGVKIHNLSQSNVDIETKFLLRKLLREPPSKTLFASITEALRSNEASDWDLNTRKIINRKGNKDTDVQQNWPSKKEVATVADGNTHAMTSTKDVGIITGDSIRKKNKKVTHLASFKMKTTEKIIRKQSPKTTKTHVKEPRIALFSVNNKYKRLDTTVQSKAQQTCVELQIGDAKSPINKTNQTSENQSFIPTPVLPMSRKLKYKTLGKWGDLLYIRHANKFTPENNESKLLLILKQPTQFPPPTPKLLNKSPPLAFCPICEEEKANGYNITDTTSDVTFNQEFKLKENFINKNKKKVVEIQNKVAYKKETIKKIKEDANLNELHKSKIFRRLKVSSFSAPIFVEMRDIGTSTPSKFFPLEPLKKLNPKPIEKRATKIKFHDVTKHTYASIAKTKKTIPTSLRFIRRAEKAVGTDSADFRPKGKTSLAPSNPKKFTYNITDFPDMESTRKLNYAKVNKLIKRWKSKPNVPTVKISRKRNSRFETDSLFVNF